MGRIVRARPDVRRNLRAPAARRAVEHRRDGAVPHQHLAGCRLRGAGCRRRGGANDLAVRLVAEIEAVGAMAIGIAQRKRADGDGQHLERGRRALARRLAGEHAGDVGFEREGLDRVAAAGPGKADAQLDRRGVRSALWQGGRPGQGYAMDRHDASEDGVDSPRRQTHDPGHQRSCFTSTPETPRRPPRCGAGSSSTDDRPRAATASRWAASARTLRPSADRPTCRAGPERQAPAARTSRRTDCTGSCLRRNSKFSIRSALSA